MIVVLAQCGKGEMSGTSSLHCVNRRQFLLNAAAATGALAVAGKEFAYSAAATIPQPRLSAPLADPGAKGFHVWNVEPIDYVAEEYLMSGVSPIWEPTSNLDSNATPHTSGLQAPFNYLQHTPNHEPRQVLGSGPYTTRIVIYRPRDMKKFTGVTVVEPIHSQSGGYVYVFNVLSRFYASRGIAVVTLQHPISFEPTIKANPERYGSLAMKDWTQFWGTVSQLGALLKSGASPLRAQTKRLYLTGYSFTGMCTSTFANFYHNDTRAAGGRPIFDGYLPHCNEYYIQPLDVPVIRVNSQSDFNYFTNPTYNPFARVPDSDDPLGRNRRYEVAGTDHGPLPEAEQGAAIPPFSEMGSCPAYATFPENGQLNHQPFFRPVFEIAVVHMEDWLTRAIAPPRAPWIVIGKGLVQAEVDENGNAVGGLRMPDVQLPIATYKVGEKECRLNGYMIPFPTDKLRTLYSSKAHYLALYDHATDSMVSQRWMLPESAERLKEHARDIQSF